MMNKFKTKTSVTLVTISLLLFFGPLFLSDKSYPQSEQDKKYEELLKQYEALKADRDNVLLQTKRLLESKRSTAELEQGLEQLAADRKLFEEEKGQILTQFEELNKEIKDLKDAKEKIETERDGFKKAYEESGKAAKIDELQNAISALKRENEKNLSDLNKENHNALLELKKEDDKKFSALRKERDSLDSDLKNKQDKMDNLAKIKDRAEGQIEELRRQLGELKKDYAGASKKNRALEREIKDIPKKFSEIARQNKMLIKETAQMHYNLGVFYTKGKEYKRAIAEFGKAAEINPEDAYSHFNLGYIYAEYLVDRKKAIEHFRHYLRLAKGNDKDIDWVRKYLLTWETYEGKTVMK